MTNVIILQTVLEEVNQTSVYLDFFRVLGGLSLKVAKKCATIYIYSQILGGGGGGGGAGMVSETYCCVHYQYHDGLKTGPMHGMQTMKN